MWHFVAHSIGDSASASVRLDTLRDRTKDNQSGISDSN
jgi:hypothetical protein